MAEDEWSDHRKTIARLAGEVAALRCLVQAIASHLPERALYAVGKSTDWETKLLQNKVREEDTDGARDFAGGFYDIATDMREMVEQELEEIASGARLRTIQPARIAKGDMLFPEKGW